MIERRHKWHASILALYSFFLFGSPSEIGRGNKRRLVLNALCLAAKSPRFNMALSGLLRYLKPPSLLIHFQKNKKADSQVPSRPYDEWLDLLRFFQLHENAIYVLGSFARHVTVYSQQVRALNLVAALRHTDRLPKGTKVAVIGGGAAGLMAAAAAAFIGADVTLLDELAGPMALQRNNRQRWLHPYIYDWPFTERSGAESQLPLLSWQAGYASDVAEQIERQWLRLIGEPKRQGLEGTIMSHWNVTEVDVDYQERRPFVSWYDHKGPTHNPNLEVDLVIMAVGFGLEPDEESWQHSYWTEDDLDGDFRRRSTPWLVSGVGDGGLTDVMRLCISQFRHHEVEELFGSIDGIDVLKLKLKELHSSNSSPNAQSIHNKFKETLWLSDGQSRWPGLTKVLREENRLRDRASVILASESRWIYGPGSSLLNRLIISQLEHLGLITFKYGRVERVSPDNGGCKVLFLGKPPVYVNRVLLRHGPKPALERFTQIWAESAELQTLWKAKGINRDETRSRLWDPGEFGPEDIGTIVTENPPGIGITSFGAPAVKRNRIFLAGNRMRSYDRETGKIVWSGAQNQLLPHGVAVGEGVIYEAEARVSAIKEVDGSVMWSVPLDRGAEFATPVVVGNTLFVGTDQGRVVALDAGTGKLTGEINCDPGTHYRSIVTGLSVQGGSLYASLTSWDDEKGLTSHGLLVAADLTGATVKWTFVSENDRKRSGFTGNVYALAGDVLVIDGLANRLYRVTHEGRQVWVTSGVPRSFSVAEPLLATNGTIIMGSSDSNVYSIDSQSGKVIWRKHVHGSVNAIARCGRGIAVFDSNMSILNQAGEIEWGPFGPGSGQQFSSRLVADGTDIFISGPGSLYRLKCSQTGEMD